MTITPVTSSVTVRASRTVWPDTLPSGDPRPAELSIDIVADDAGEQSFDGTSVRFDPPWLHVDGPERDVLVHAFGVPVQRCRLATGCFDLRAPLEARRLGWDPGPPDAAETRRVVEADARRLPRHGHEVVRLDDGRIGVVVHVDPDTTDAVRVRVFDGDADPDDALVVVGTAGRASRLVAAVDVPAGVELVRYEVDVGSGGRWTPVDDAAPAYLYPLPADPFVRPSATEFLVGATAPTPPAWAEGAVLYHVLVDRFARHDGGVIAPPEIAGHLGFAGGTIRGLIERIDHVAGLGVDGILCSPLTPGHMHVAYDVVDLCAVDDRLGTEQDVRDLCDVAHERGMRVVLDVELSYLGDRHPAAQEVGGRAIRRRPDGTPWGWYAGNPTFRPIDHAEPTIRRALIDSLDWWCDLGIDGFRMDSAHAAPLGFWSEVGHHLARRPDVFTFGEITAPHPERVLLADRLHGFCDFDLEHAVRGWLGGTIATDLLVAAIEQTDGACASGSVPVTFVECHDDDRLATTASPEVVSLGVDLLLCLPGAPLLLQGTEIGQTQARVNPPEAEQPAPVPWERADRERFAHHRRAVHRRHEIPALRTGRTDIVTAADDRLTFRRRTDTSVVEVTADRRRSTLTVDHQTPGSPT